MRKAYLLVLLVIFAAAMSGCGNKVVEKIEIHLSEFAFDPNLITFPAGAEVHLILINDGALEHELLIGRNPGDGYEVDLFDHDPNNVEASGGEGFHVRSDEEIAEEGYHVELEPGASGTLIFTVPESKIGEWEMGCFLDGGVHYESGMHGTVTVTTP
jgi:uncharacterized cupredoxin-like copper-binding protein